MGLTQRQFALKIGLKTQSAISKIEEGLLSPKEYDLKIRTIFNKYKNERIKYLTDQIDYLNSL